MIVSLVVAMSENGVIGRGNALPWHLPADLKYFKALTTGHVVMMGRKTFESIGGKPLPGRPTVVVTRDEQFSAPNGVRVAHDVDEALSAARQMAEDVGDDEMFILGGSEIFRAALPVADRLYVTLVHAQVEGDVLFPEVDWRHWTLERNERREADHTNAYAMSFRVYERER